MKTSYPGKAGSPRANVHPSAVSQVGLPGQLNWLVVKWMRGTGAAGEFWIRRKTFVIVWKTCASISTGCGRVGEGTAAAWRPVPDCSRRSWWQCPRSVASVAGPLRICLPRRCVSVGAGTRFSGRESSGRQRPELQLPMRIGIVSLCRSGCQALGRGNSPLTTTTATMRW